MDIQKRTIEEFESHNLHKKGNFTWNLFLKRKRFIDQYVERIYLEVREFFKQDVVNESAQLVSKLDENNITPDDILLDEGPSKARDDHRSKSWYNGM